MKEIKTSAYNKNGKKKDYKYNPWAVCHTTVDKDEDEEKYERCVKKVKQKQAQIQAETMDLLARYIADGYLSAAEMADTPNATSERYWADYYSEDYDQNKGETVSLKNVPMEIASRLLVQGTSEQVFSDGYEAANAAAPYVVQNNAPEELPPDTPKGMEDDNPVAGIDF